ncbi:hypothetical protein BCY86_08690 [Pajaroellobacter abortibovis]|uniref:HYDIN/VesB/CFA65-like Ig-like domain-containing protein n=2 Tax=Pajaroellobacter abortibovis TaxID=1882918 RepID=A0A1L6MZA1_9BACT|nr:hypothetical protein BCY86_08690 [Pajaroellobacter abortibovis]
MLATSLVLLGKEAAGQNGPGADADVTASICGDNRNCSAVAIPLKTDYMKGFPTAANTGWMPACPAVNEQIPDHCSGIYFQFRAALDLRSISGFPTISVDMSQKAVIKATWDQKNPKKIILTPASNGQGIFSVKYRLTPITDLYFRIPLNASFSSLKDLEIVMPMSLILQTVAAPNTPADSSGTISFIPWAFDPVSLQTKIQGNNTHSSIQKKSVDLLTLNGKQLNDIVNNNWFDPDRNKTYISLAADVQSTFVYQTVEFSVPGTDGYFRGVDSTVEFTCDNGSGCDAIEGDAELKAQVPFKATVVIFPEIKVALQLKILGDGILSMFGAAALNQVLNSVMDSINNNIQNTLSNSKININTPTPITLDIKQQISIPLPNVSVPNAVSFGQVSSGFDATKTVKIRNTGKMAAHVESVTSSNKAFTPTPGPFDIPPEGDHTISINYRSTTSTGTEKADLMIVSNDPRSPQKIVLSNKDPSASDDDYGKNSAADDSQGNDNQAATCGNCKVNVDDSAFLTIPTLGWFLRRQQNKQKTTSTSRNP